MKILILVIGIIIVALMFFFAYKNLNKKFKDEEAGKEKPSIYLSKTGSIIFYSLISVLLIFFGIMFIMWKMQ
jgi:hypothetical protein